ncbi:DNA polymerase III subunit delta [bacterium]|nr:DNA polymerase III subunit delta [bacterium]NBX98154.1 DNA polymerase III subunit delta [bacterium]NDC94497.1 DNA polymerase III subunit delta [bacterium]NDD84484.1 DNA polymerase III subunit delta [bacterium]NDG29231.1 DNA polymerase III subunit delta [bacterium]
MITTLTGSNAYELSNTLRSIKAVFTKQFGDFATESVDASELELRALLDIVSALPFLSTKRLVVMQGLAANKLASEHIQTIINNVSDQTDVYIVEPKLDKRSVLYKTLKKETDFKEFLQIDAYSAPQWLVTEAKNRGGELSNGDARYLVSRMGVEQTALSNQLDVLLLYNPKINRTAIDILTDKTPQSTVFELIEAAFSGNTRLALDLYEDQRAQNVEPLAIEALFVWQLHALLLVKAAGQAKKPLNQLGISPYVAQKSAALVARRTLPQLKGYVAKLTAAEFALKTTAVNADETLKNFIIVLGQ